MYVYQFPTLPMGTFVSYVCINFSTRVWGHLCHVYNCPHKKYTLSLQKNWHEKYTMSPQRNAMGTVVYEIEIDKTCIIELKGIGSRRAH